MVIVGRPFGYQPWALAWIMVFSCVALAATFVVLQAKKGSARIELEHMLLENAAREFDFQLSVAEMKCDIETAAARRRGETTGSSRRPSGKQDRPVFPPPPSSGQGALVDACRILAGRNDASDMAKCFEIGMYPW